MARGEEVDRRIHAAAMALLRAHGPSAVTVEAVAAASGVARTTIYRRHRDRADVLESALKELAAGHLVAPSPDVWSDMRDAIYLTITTFQENEGVGVFLGLVQTGDPELVELIRNKLLRPRIAQAVRRLADGVEAGQVRVDADVEVATDLVLGAVAARFAHAGTFPPEWVESVVAMMRRALEPVEAAAPGPERAPWVPANRGTVEGAAEGQG